MEQSQDAIREPKVAAGIITPKNSSGGCHNGFSREEEENRQIVANFAIFFDRKSPENVQMVKYKSDIG